MGKQKKKKTMFDVACENLEKALLEKQICFHGDEIYKFACGMWRRTDVDTVVALLLPLRATGRITADVKNYLENLMLADASRAADGFGEFQVDYLPSNYIAVQNGAINIETGNVEKVGKKYIPQNVIRFKYNKNLKRYSPKADTIIKDWARNDSAIEYMIYEVAANAISTDRDGCAYFLYGAHGANGKSLYLEALKNLLGGYGENGKDNWTAGNIEDIQNPTTAIRLEHCLAFFDDDVKDFSDGASKDLTMIIKKVVTGGEIEGKALYRGNKFIKPRATIIAGTNFVPNFGNFESNHAVDRRLRVIPFDNYFGNLPDSVKKETAAFVQSDEFAEHLLYRAVEVLRAKTGLYSETPRARELKHGFDRLADAEDDADEFSFDNVVGLESAVAKQMYNEWATINGAPMAKNSNEFQRVLADNGLQIKRTAGTCGHGRKRVVVWM